MTASPPPPSNYRSPPPPPLPDHEHDHRSPTAPPPHPPPLIPDKRFEPQSDPAARDPLTVFPLDHATFEITSMPQEDLIAYGNIAPVLHSLRDLKVVRLSKTLAMKFDTTVSASEAETMKYIAANLPGVRTPRLYRFFGIEHSFSYFSSEGYMVMDFIDGRSLDSCWDSLCLDIQANAVEQVGAMVNQLQSMHGDQPGVVGGRISRGTWFSDYGVGPFPTKGVLQAWLDWELNLSKLMKQASSETEPLQCSYFVLTHGDLNLRNLILDTSNQVWLIDWGCAGFYSPIFEAESAIHQSRFTSFSRQLLLHIYNNPEELVQLEACSFGTNRIPFSLPSEMDLITKEDVARYGDFRPLSHRAIQ